MKTFERPWLILVAFLVLAIIIYYPALQGEFLLDDWSYISGNALITDSGNPFKFWYTFDVADYWPLFYTVIWTMWRLFHYSWIYYHLSSICFHALNAVLVVLLARQYKLRGSLIAGLFFLVHPVQVQSVAWIFQIKTLLATSLVLISWLAYLKSLEENGPKQAYRVSVVTFFLSLCAKTATVALPLVFLLHHFLKEEAPQKRALARAPLEKTEIVKVLRRISPFAILSAVFSILTMAINHYHFLLRGFVTWDGTWIDRLVLVGQNFWYYALSLFYPRVIFLHPRVLPKPDLWFSWIPLVLLFALGGLLLGTKNLSGGKNRVFFFFSYLASLIPVLGIVNIPYMRETFVADNWHYLAIPPAAVFLGATAQSFFDRSQKMIRYVLLLVGLLAFLFLGKESWSEAHYYQDEEAIWKHVVEQDPNNAFVWNALGVYYQRKFRKKEAHEAYERAVQIDPKEPPALNNLADEAVSDGNLDRARALLAELVKYDVKNPVACQLLSKIERDRGHREAARQILIDCLERGNLSPSVKADLCGMDPQSCH